MITQSQRSALGLGFYSVSLLGLGVGYVVGHYTPELSHTLDRQIAADNFVTVTLYAICAMVYLNQDRILGPASIGDIKFRRAGLVVTFASWGLHRLYWGVWRHFRDNGDFATADWMRDYLAWATSVLQIGIWVGAALILLPVFSSRFGSHTWWVPGVLIPTLWLAYFMTFSWI